MTIFITSRISAFGDQPQKHVNLTPKPPCLHVRLVFSYYDWTSLDLCSHKQLDRRFRCIQKKVTASVIRSTKTNMITLLSIKHMTWTVVGPVKRSVSEPWVPALKFQKTNKLQTPSNTATVYMYWTDPYFKLQQNRNNH